MLRMNQSIKTLALVILCGSACAQSTVTSAPQDPSPFPPAARGPALAVSISLAQSALAACSDRGYLSAVSVVDLSGAVKVTLVADGFRGLPATSQKKAATAVHFNLGGAELEEKMKTDAALAAEIAANANYNAHPGSLLLRAGSAVIGGIGITGPPHEAGDACLKLAVENYKAS